jgi:hypothetical protein
MVLGNVEAWFAHYLVENKILQPPHTYPLQYEAIHKHPSVLSNL